VPVSPVHIRANEGDVAPDVLLVGDPGRATRTAELLESPRCYNEHRGLLGYTGMLAGRPVSVQTTGMGCPSAAIVCEELAMLGARRLIRMGTCGALQPFMQRTDLVIATASCSLDGTVRAYVGEDGYSPAATFAVVRGLDDAASARGARHHVGLIATEDALYAVREDWVETWRARGVLAQEMEASAIFTVAALRGLEAGCILVASNSAGQHERLPDEELAPAVDLMIEVTLDALVALRG
jgi:purine-nucleoside phosphorylase